jgi:membrane-bound ClpP family serine protease
MQTNVGTIDRLIRLAIGVILVALPFVGNLPVFDAAWATVLSVIVGLVMLVVSATRICPVYAVLGIRSCKS